jgi:hypothetical protein
VEVDGPGNNDSHYRRGGCEHPPVGAPWSIRQVRHDQAAPFSDPGDKDAGAGYAFPSRTVYHNRDSEPDPERRQDAEALVCAWCSAQERPFPNFTADYRKKTRNTLDYPPEGSPEASQ